MEVCDCSVFRCSLLYVPSAFAVILMGGVSRDYCVALSPSAMGLSAVCDCGIS